MARPRTKHAHGAGFEKQVALRISQQLYERMQEAATKQKKEFSEVHRAALQKAFG